jgi:hypothetical protein
MVFIFTETNITQSVGNSLRCAFVLLYEVGMNTIRYHTRRQSEVHPAAK